MARCTSGGCHPGGLNSGGVQLRSFTMFAFWGSRSHNALENGHEIAYSEGQEVR